MTEMAKLEGTINGLAKEVLEIKNTLRAHIEEMKQFMTRIETSVTIPVVDNNSKPWGGLPLTTMEWEEAMAKYGNNINAIHDNNADVNSHFYVDVEGEEWKFETVCDICETVLGSITTRQEFKFKIMAVFVQTDDRAAWLTDLMCSKGYKATDKLTLKDMDPDSRVLITTHDLAPYIDAPVLINYDFPTQPREYHLHKHGLVINFVINKERGILHDTQHFHDDILLVELPVNFAHLISS